MTVCFSWNSTCLCRSRDMYQGLVLDCFYYKYCSTGWSSNSTRPNGLKLFNKHSAETQTDVHHLTNVKDLVLIKGHWRQAPILEAKVKYHSLPEMVLHCGGGRLVLISMCHFLFSSKPVFVHIHKWIDYIFFCTFLNWFIGVSIWSEQQENPNERSGKRKCEVQCELWL